MQPTFQKLNLKDQTEILILNAPDSFESEISLLSDVIVRRDLGLAPTIQFFLAFVTRQAEVDSLATVVGERAVGDAVIWFAYPKGTSKKYCSEFNRDTGWDALGRAGFEAVRQVAIDEDWSALRFRRVEYIKSLKRDAKRAMSSGGIARLQDNDKDASSDQR